MILVTTSWDDGDPKDHRVAELLKSRGLSGTFYIPMIGYNGRATLDAHGLRSLNSMSLEIGGHGLSHHTLPKFRSKELVREVTICKERLEDVIGRDVSMFAYPKGRHSHTVVDYLKRAGYLGARTTQMLGHTLDFDPFKMPVTLQVYPHSRQAYMRNLGRTFSLRTGLEYLNICRRAGSWIELAKTMFDRVMQEGGVWHLSGHSWEIQEHEWWDDLARVLDYVSNRPGVRYLSNIDVVRTLPGVHEISRALISQAR